jgi:hypothetical protein
VSALRVMAMVLLVSATAWAESETANLFDMLGWDPVAKQLFLRDCHTDKGPWELWTIDFKEPSRPSISIKPLEKKTEVPDGLKVVKSVQLDEVSLSGSIRKEQLEREENKLVKRYDLRIILEWKGARTVSDFISYHSPEMQLMEVFQVPEGPCALAIVSWNAHHAGVQKQRALVMCPDDRKISGAPPPAKK